MNEETVALMNNGRLLERLGPEIAEAWDFKAAAERITRLRSALELFKQFNVSDSPLSVEKKNLEDTIKLLKDAENKLSKADMGRKHKSEALVFGVRQVLFKYLSGQTLKCNLICIDEACLNYVNTMLNLRRGWSKD